MLKALKGQNYRLNIDKRSYRQNPINW